MGNVSGASSGSSSIRRGRITGVLKKCWCGEHVLGLISRSVPNPYRRYYRCHFAATQKLENDNHTFKWVDEALLNEIETLQMKNARFKEEIKELATERNEFKKLVFDKVQLKLEKEIFERVEDVLQESASHMKKMMIVVVIGCIIMLGGSKLVG